MRFTLVRMFMLAALPLAAAEPVAHWIWHEYRPGDTLLPGTEHILVRKTFAVPDGVTRAELRVCGDDEAVVHLNGRQVMVAGRKADPSSVNYSATQADVTTALAGGTNVLAAHVRNGGGPFGLIARLEFTLQDGSRRFLVTDDSWRTTTHSNANWTQVAFGAADWRPARSIAVHGDNPWFEVLNPPTTARTLNLPPGFEATLLREARPDEGSWVAMTIDDRGRLIISPQKLVSTNRGGMLRLTLDAGGQITKEETIDLPVGAAQGLAFAQGALYVNGYAVREAKDTHGFYRVTDSNGDDVFDHYELLKTLHNRGGSHGPHGIVPGPDGSLYHISGDYSKVVDGILPDSPHRNYDEDLLLPREWDASGHALGVVAPMGHVQKTDPHGREWRLFCAGLRNPYDLAFNEHGEAFTFDADMEYDFGLPWYRPTRVYHLVSGGEYGHREGTGKWPYYHPDSLPPVTDIGLGSPCGVTFGTGSKFPPKYRRALFLCDWAWGNVYAVHLTPEGASYTGTFEKFATGRPLNAMDLEFGRDGAMYLITGGNDTQTGLYRIHYTGPTVEERLTKAERQAQDAAAQARALRRQLEAFHGRQDAGAVAAAWPHLDSKDRFLRYAARVALEWQETSTWHARALAEKRTRASLTALLAVARTGKPEVKPALLEALARLEWSRLEEAQQLELLRVYGVAFARLGGPDNEARRALLRRFEPHFPAKSDALNRELCQLLVFLDSPEVVRRSMALVAADPAQEEQIHYIFHLRRVPVGWTPELRRAYFEWYQNAAGRFRGGVSFNKFLANFKKDAIATLTAAERESLAPYLEDFPVAAKAAPVRPSVKEWKLEEILADLDQVDSGRNFASGRAAFEAAQCLSCHRFRHDGGSAGPDLTAVGARFSRRDILEAIMEPSKVVMEQYQNTTVVTRGGDDFTGRIVVDDDQRLVLITNPLTGDRVEVAKPDVASRAPAKLSPMPEGLVNMLTKDEILDLVAFLESGGHAGHAAFRR
jgi:putative heme-binding domain-containing protein